MNITIELTAHEYKTLETAADRVGSQPAEYAAHRVRMHLQAQEPAGEWMEADGVPQGEALSGLEYAADSVDLLPLSG